MTQQEAAMECYLERWKLMVEAESIEEMDEIEDSTSCTLCDFYIGKDCTCTCLSSNQRDKKLPQRYHCCYEYRRWSKACYKSKNFPVAHYWAEMLANKILKLAKEKV